MTADLLDQAGSPVVVIFTALLGAIIGSFLNVCILRWPADESVVRPASRCPRCGRGLAWYDNVPIVSWLVLRGKCRGCALPISPMYPLVELGTAIIWGWLGLRHGLSVEMLAGATFGTILLGIALTDAREMIIPDEFSVGGLVLGLGFSLTRGWPGMEQAVLGAAAGFTLVYLIREAGAWWLKQEAMGGGDMMMMAMIGAFLGWGGVLATVMIGAVLGLMVFGPVALLRRDLKIQLPFGVFLAAAAGIVYAAGPVLFRWYQAYLGLG